jgi:hypothetical protein
MKAVATATPNQAQIVDWEAAAELARASRPQPRLRYHKAEMLLHGREIVVIV